MTDTENDRAFQAKKTELIDQQKTYCQLFQITWKCFNKDQDLGELKKYISYACYGLPKHPEEDVTVTEYADMCPLYSSEQQSRVKNILKWKCFNKVQDLGELKKYISYACYGLPELPEEDVTVTEYADMCPLYSSEQQSRVKNILKWKCFNKVQDLGELKKYISYACYGLPELPEEDVTVTEYADMVKNILKWKCFNKVQDLGVLKMFSYACYGLLERPKEDVTAIEYAEMCPLYSKEQQLQVNKISDLIFSYTDSVVNLGHTYLLCLMDIKEEFTTVVFHFRQGKSVKFVDMNCRLYVDWEDFTKNNQLPDCMYYAPKDGLYRSKAEIWYYYSPASTLYSKVLKNTDLAVGAVGLTTAVAGCLVAGPAILAASTTCMVYGGVRSVYNLVDRHSHEQSVGLLDTEARWSWLNLASSGVTSVSSVATGNAKTIVKICGKYGNTATRTLQAVNIATLIVDASALSMSSYHLYKKSKTKEGISPMDVMHLGQQALMFCGAVVNVRRTHEFLSRTSSTTLRVSDKTLTKTQKRNLQQEIAKRRQNGLPVVTQDTVTVSAVSADSYYLLARVNAYVGFQILKLNYRGAEAKLVLAENIFFLVTDFSRGKIDLTTFVNCIIPHLKNTLQLFQEEKENLLRFCTKLKNYCKGYCSDGVFDDNVSNIYSMIDDAIIRCNSVELDIPKSDVSLAAIPSSVGLYPVFEVARDLAFKCKTDGTMKSYIETFHNSILFVINKLKHVIESSVSFDEIYDLNKEMYGEVLANKMLDSINVCSENDYMNKILLEKTVELCRQTEVECEFLNSHSTFMGQEFNAKICDSLLDIYYSFVKNFFANDQWNISNSEAVLKRLLDYLTSSLNCINWWGMVDWILDELLIDNFPKAEITSLCTSGNNTNKSSFDWPNDTKRYVPDDLEVQPELLDKYNVILQLAERLMQNLSKNEFAKNHQKLIIRFLMKKLETDIKDKLHSVYKRNKDIFGIRYTAHMYEKVKPINDERRNYLFHKIIQNYNNQIETMVTEYFNFYVENRYSRNVDHVKIWSSILDDNKAMYEINCERCRDKEYYKGIVRNVLQITTFQVVDFVETTDLVALKFRKSRIEKCTSVVFHFGSNGKALLVVKKLIGQFYD